MTQLAPERCGSDYRVLSGTGADGILLAAGYWTIFQGETSRDKLGLAFQDISGRKRQPRVGEPSQPPLSAVLRGLLDGSEDNTDLVLWALRCGSYYPVCRQVDTWSDREAALAQEEWEAVVCNYHLLSFGVVETPALVRLSRLQLPFVIVLGRFGEDAAVV